MMRSLSAAGAKDNYRCRSAVDQVTPTRHQSSRMMRATSERPGRFRDFDRYRGTLCWCGVAPKVGQAVTEPLAVASGIKVQSSVAEVALSS